VVGARLSLVNLDGGETVEQESEYYLHKINSSKE